jgi:MFS family permease
MTRTLNRTVALLIAASFVSSLHFYLAVFFFYLEHRGLTLFQANALQIVPLFTTTLAEVPTGVFGDRYGRKLSVAIGLACVGLSEASMLVARGFWSFVALQALLGVGFALISGSVQAMLIDSYPDDAERETRSARALGWHSAAGQLGFVLSGLLGALLFPDTSESRYFWPIVATASAWLLAAAIVLLVRDARPQLPGGTQRSSLALLRDGLRVVRGNAALRRTTALSIFSDPLIFYWVLLYQPVLARSNVPAPWFGPAFAAAGLLSTVLTARGLALRNAISKRHGLSVLLLLPALLYAAQALPYPAPLAVMLFVLHRGVMDVAKPMLDAAINTHIASDARATTLSMLSLVRSGYLALLGVPLGWLADASLSAAYLAVAVLIALGVIAFQGALTRTDRQSADL